MAACGVLLAANVVNNRLLPDRDAAYVASCSAGAVALLAIARGDGRTAEDLGLGAHSAGRGLAVGGVTAGLTIAGFLAALITPQGRVTLRDERVAARGRRGALVAALVRVPFGTVLLEEVAFRSVLPALLTPRLGPRRASTAAASLFGVWHVLPSLDMIAANDGVNSLVAGSRTRAVTLAVASTAAVGVAFSTLQRLAGSVLAPVLVHWAANATGYLAAAVATPKRRGSLP